jgi:hypothetical protein
VVSLTDSAPLRRWRHRHFYDSLRAALRARERDTHPAGWLEVWQGEETIEVGWRTRDGGPLLQHLDGHLQVWQGGMWRRLGAEEGFDPPRSARLSPELQARCQRLVDRQERERRWLKLLIVLTYLLTCAGLAVLGEQGRWGWCAVVLGLHALISTPLLIRYGREVDVTDPATAQAFGALQRELGVALNRARRGKSLSRNPPARPDPWTAPDVRVRSPLLDVPPLLVVFGPGPQADIVQTMLKLARHAAEDGRSFLHDTPRLIGTFPEEVSRQCVLIEDVDELIALRPGPLDTLTCHLSDEDSGTLARIIQVRGGRLIVGLSARSETEARALLQARGMATHGLLTIPVEPH